MIELVAVRRSMFGTEWTSEDRAILRSRSGALTMAAHDMIDAIEVRAHIYQGNYAPRLVSAARAAPVYE